MKLQRFSATVVLPTGLEEAWDFFSNPRNLSYLTPPWLRLTITSPLPDRMHPGMIIAYTVRPILGVPVDWVTEITNVVEGKLFVDEQRSGPYRFWHHQHHFRQVPGGIEVRDVVHYALPFGPLGRLAAPFVGRRIGGIFDYRRAALARRFGGVAARSANGAVMVPG